MQAKLYEYIGAAFLEWYLAKSGTEWLEEEYNLSEPCTVCGKPAKYNGFLRNGDSIHVRLTNVCRDHAPQLMGWENLQQAKEI